MTVHIATDGSGQASGPGGWAAILRCNGSYKEIFGSVAEATNNSMEITAAIMGLRALTLPCNVQITTDSEYLMNGAKFGLPKWKRNEWRRNDGDAVKNRELWEQLDYLLQRHFVSWAWVKGHSGHEDNERADVLAGEARASLLPSDKKPKKRPISIKTISDADLMEAVRALPVTELHRLHSTLMQVSGEAI